VCRWPQSFATQDQRISCFDGFDRFSKFVDDCDAGRSRRPPSGFPDHCNPPSVGACYEAEEESGKNLVAGMASEYDTASKKNRGPNAPDQGCRRMLEKQPRTARAIYA
jgi:hypothetical protein